MTSSYIGTDIYTDTSIDTSLSHISIFQATKKDSELGPLLCSEDADVTVNVLATTLWSLSLTTATARVC